MDERRTLRSACARALGFDAARPAIEYRGRWYDWGAIRGLADRVRARIAASGAGADDPVAFVPRNDPASIATLIALLAEGRTVRMVYAFQSPAGIARDVARCGAPVAILSALDAAEIETVLRDGGMAGLALDGMDATAISGAARIGPDVHVERAPAPQVEILTSGTTGPPKRFAISHALIARDFLPAGAGADDPLTAPPVLLFMPLGNISGLYTTLPVLLGGRRATLLDRFTVAGWRDHLVRYRPAQSGLPPSGVQMVLDADVPRADLASVRTMGTGAAPLDPGVQRAFEDRYGIPILLSYGATEFGGPVTRMTAELHARWGAAKHGTVGRAFGGAAIRVVDPETGAELPADAEGLLEVRTPRIGPDWIRTSDIAAIDADGFLFHRGRADGAIVRGGFKIRPETIERALMEHSAVAAAAVVALPDRTLGQVPGAAISLRPGAVATIADLESLLRTRLYATQIPARWRIVGTLPLTPSLKISRPGVIGLFDSAD